jgi:hypothetical protein
MRSLGKAWPLIAKFQRFFAQLCDLGVKLPLENRGAPGGDKYIALSVAPYLIA